MIDTSNTSRTTPPPPHTHIQNQSWTWHSITILSTNYVVKTVLRTNQRLLLVCPNNTFVWHEQLIDWILAWIKPAVVQKKHWDKYHSTHVIEHKQRFDNGFSLKSIHHVKNCNPLKLTNLEIPHQNVLKTNYPEGQNLRFGVFISLY